MNGSFSFWAGLNNPEFPAHFTDIDMTPDQAASYDIQVQPVDVLVRYNTRQDNDNPACWRVLLPGDTAETFSERFAANIIIRVPSRTSEDLIAPGLVKWHFRARGFVAWLGDVCYVSAQPGAPRAD